MIPVSLVTGFLGSGKTTFLQRCVERLRERRIVYLVNEFSPTDVDGQLLDLPPDQLVTIAGGSIFCRCLVTDFIGRLREIADKHAAIDGVIIEASGIADPKVVAQMLAETRLDEAFHLATIISIVDPDTFGDLLETLPNIRAQVEAAGVAIINKVDLHDEAALGATERQLGAINPDLVIHRARYADVAVDLFADARPTTLTGDYALCTDPNYGRMQITPRDDLDVHQLAALLEPIRGTLYRLKGFVRSDGRLQYLDVSRAGIETRPTSRHDATPQLVCIYPPAAFAEVRAVLEKLEKRGN